MFIERNVGPFIKEAFKKLPVVTLTGPRQSGKSTLLKHLFPDLPYVNLESIAVRNLATEDPVGFIAQYKNGAIFDEAQRVPEIFSTIQVTVDEISKPSMFIISGSQNFLLLETISQSLAGRTAIFHLPPLSVAELSDRAPSSINQRMFTGGYPRIYDQGLDPTEWLDAYVQTFIERDIRSLKNVTDLEQFCLFVRMCAARSGQILDLTSLGNDCGISSNTAKSWLSLLETSFIIFRLQPYHKNFNKRLIKSSKLYFWDSGLLCYLLGIKRSEELSTHASRGHIFETFIIGEIRKHFMNHRMHNNLYYWRDKTHEVDCLVEIGQDRYLPIEIKAGQTYTSEYRKSLDYLSRISGQSGQQFIIYAGSDAQQLPEQTSLLPDSDLPKLFKTIK